MKIGIHVMKWLLQLNKIMYMSSHVNIHFSPCGKNFIFRKGPIDNPLLSHRYLMLFITVVV